MTNKTFTGLALVSFLAGIAGIIVSFLLLKEDVTSTAHTVFEYFPIQYGVTPSSTWSGAIVLGIFTSILQVVTASVMFSSNFSTQNRWLASITFASSCWFDNWTDVVFRSGNLTGDIPIAIITTLAFYTVGSEILQGLSWLVFFTFWRRAISDFMWGIAVLQAGIGSITAEWKRFKQAALRKEDKDRDINLAGTSFPINNHHPVNSSFKSLNRLTEENNRTAPHADKSESSRFNDVKSLMQRKAVDAKRENLEC